MFCFSKIWLPLLLMVGEGLAAASPVLRGRGFSPLIVSLVVAPSAITFSNTNPDTSPTPQTSLATFIHGLGAGTNAWTLGVAATSATVTNCPQVPISAISLTCSSVVVTGITAPSSACASGSIALSTAAQTIASGQDGPIISALVTHVATMSVAFTDSWKYPGTTGGSACSVTLTYSLTRN